MRHGPRELANYRHPKTKDRVVLLRMPNSIEVAVKTFAPRSSASKDTRLMASAQAAHEFLTTSGYKPTWVRPEPPPSIKYEYV